MNRELRDNLTFIAILVLLALIVTDCSVGNTRYCPGTVQQHVYRPEYVTTSTDKHGHVTITVHPAEYHLLVECHQPDHVANVEVTIYKYVMIHDGQAVEVGERVGRWSKIIWLKWIEKTQTSQQGSY